MRLLQKKFYFLEIEEDKNNLHGTGYLFDNRIVFLYQCALID